AAAAPGLPRALLLDELWDGWHEAAERLGCVAVVTHHPLMDAALVRRLHAGGRRALVYTANAPADVARLRAAGVDGIITDEVQRFADDARRGT
ncbi:MAG TPA: glycerophosphodiester phosphodiesterase family protein, partial [Burkholderiaceae bacterium]